MSDRDPVMRPASQAKRDEVGLPIKVFLYTLDQVAYLASMDVSTLKRNHVHFDTRSVGPRPLSKLLARNIAEPMQHPEWRIAEEEVVRWLRFYGFRVRGRGWVAS